MDAEFTKQDALRVRAEVETLVRAYAEQNGLRLVEIGPARWKVTECRIELRFESADLEPAPRRAWKAHMRLWPESGLREEWLGLPVTICGNRFVVVGLKARRNRGEEVLLSRIGGDRRQYFVTIPAFVAHMTKGGGQ